MARPSKQPDTLESILERRKQLREELAALDEREKAARIAAQDAGRKVLYHALSRVKIPAMDKADANRIASAIASLGAQAVAAHLTASNPTPSQPKGQSPEVR